MKLKGNEGNPYTYAYLYETCKVGINGGTKNKVKKALRNKKRFNCFEGIQKQGSANDANLKEFVFLRSPTFFDIP